MLDILLTSGALGLAVAFVLLQARKAFLRRKSGNSSGCAPSCACGKSGKPITK